MARIEQSTPNAARKKSNLFTGNRNTSDVRRAPMDDLFVMKRELRRDDFSAMPFPKASGYHSKTIAYSIWHIFRIEDIAADNPKRRYRNAKNSCKALVSA